MKSKGKKTNIAKITPIDISDNEIQQNISESNKRKFLLLEVPIAITIILAIIYILTQKWILLIFIALIFFVSLFGIEGNSTTCPECHKWGKVLWNEKHEKKVRTIKHTITKADGTQLTKEEKEEVDRRRGKCLNCGKEVQKEKIKRVSN